MSQEQNEKIHHWLYGNWSERKCPICGWAFEDAPVGCHPGDCSQRPVPKVRADAPGDYSTDLNAMAEALKVAGERGLENDYNYALTDVLFGGRPETIQNKEWIFAIATATAPQQAEALVRVIQEGER